MKNEIIYKINVAITQQKNILIFDNNKIFITLLTELDRYRDLAIGHRPLTDHEKETVGIGRVAARELDDLYPDYVTLLSNIGALLREE